MSGEGREAIDGFGHRLDHLLRADDAEMAVGYQRQPPRTFAGAVGEDLSLIHI